MGGHNTCLRFGLLNWMLCHHCPHHNLKFVIRYLQHVIGVFGDRFYRLNLKEKRILVEFETTYVVGKEKVLKGFWGF